MNRANVLMMVTFWMSTVTLLATYVDVAKIVLTGDFHINTYYFYGRKVLPFAFFSLFLCSKLGIPRYVEKILSKASLLAVAVLVGLAFLLVANYVDDVPFASSFGFHWQYAAPIEWIVAVVASTLLFSRAIKFYVGLTVSYLIMFFGGFLYELPMILLRNGHIDWVHHSHPLFFASEVFALPFLAYMLHVFKWQPNRLFLVCLVGWLVCHAIFLNPSVYTLDYYVWIARIPSIVLLLSLPFGLPKPTGVKV